MTENTATINQEDVLKRLKRAVDCGNDSNVTLNVYNEWGNLYDKDMSILGYTGHCVTADSVAGYFQTNRHAVRILDVAAGTGLAAEKLKELGFCRIDAVEPSKALIEEAKKKKVYDRFICDFVTENPLDIKADTYDAVTVSGGMGPGHLPCGSLYEIIRVVKPGGIVCIVTRDEHIQNVGEYKDTLEPLMQRLEQEGKWKMIERSNFPDFLPGKLGIKFVFTIC